MENVITHLEEIITFKEDGLEWYKEKFLSNPIESITWFRAVFKDTYNIDQLKLLLKSLIDNPNQTEEIIEKYLSETAKALVAFNFKTYFYLGSPMKVHLNEEMTELRRMSRNWHFDCLQELLEIYTGCLDILKGNYIGMRRYLGYTVKISYHLNAFSYIKGNKYGG